jgi:hypothetical protein
MLKAEDVRTCVETGSNGYGIQLDVHSVNQTVVAQAYVENEPSNIVGKTTSTAFSVKSR